MAMDPWSRQALLREGLVLAVAAVLAVATAVLVPHETSTPLLALALVYVYGVGGVVVLHVRDSRRAARQRRSRAERERAVPLGTVVEAAVREERRRLALDIRRVLLEALSEVHERSGRLLEADRSDEDVARAVPAIRARTQLATSELRRLLGILRAAEGTAGAPGQHELPSDGVGLPGPHPVPGRSGPLVLGRPPRRDVVETVVIVALAGLECAINLPSRPGGASPLVVGATLLAGALFVGRAAAPVPTAVAQGVVFAGGALLGAPVMSGAWMVRGVGGVLWRSAAAAPRRLGLPAAALLAVTVVASRYAEPAIGVAASAAVVLLALVGGVVSAVTRHRAALAREEEERQARLADAQVRRAVAGERLRLARELHDTVSHSVGVIAMQLNVLDVATSAEQRAQALAAVHATSEDALRELSGVDELTRGVVDTHPARTLDDVEALVDRVRGAGARVELDVTGTPPRAHLPVIYRLAQEALTNALVHAPGAAVRLQLDSGPGGTRLVVQDDGPGPVPPQAPAHYGTVGLRERVQLVSGTLHVGPAPEGGFVVSAHLPATARVGHEEVAP